MRRDAAQRAPRREEGQRAPEGGGGAEGDATRDKADVGGKERREARGEGEGRQDDDGPARDGGERDGRKDRSREKKSKKRKSGKRSRRSAIFHIYTLYSGNYAFDGVNHAANRAYDRAQFRLQNYALLTRASASTVRCPIH